MGKNKYQDFLRAKVQGALAEAKAASNLSHQGVKGTILEILISKLFRPLLPSDIGVGTGQIIENHTGKISTQMDIVLYDKSILPPVLFDESTGIFPVEAVLYTIEVKTTLTKKDLRIAHDSAKFLNSFLYLPGLKNEDGSDKHHSIDKVKSVIFALNTTLTGNRLTEADRYKSIYYPDDEPYLVAICVAGDSYWFNDGRALLRKRIIHFICYFSSGNKPFKALSLGRSLESAKNFILYFGSDSSWIHYYAT
ncbi:hypothetical protein LFR79_003608, partial [Vibrio cholerae]|nr:hypothetical protein [Vibrio cholerae]